jgi:Ca-activated chloride channel homolog
VPVEKTKGQQVFEDVIRGRIDPGLLEVTSGNNFKLRVYPLPPNGTKRVVLRVAEALTNNLYRVPISFGDKIGRLDLDIRVNGSAAAPTLREGSVNGLKFTQEFFGKSGNYRLRETRNEFAGEGMLEIAIRTAATELVQVENFDGKNYFVADVPIAIREGVRDIPNVVGILWDSSASARSRDRAREFALLDAYFQKMRDGEVRLTRIRDVTEKSETFRIRGGDWNTLRDALQNTPYDGATNLGAFIPESGVREYLLFSDGLSNYGEKAFAQTNVPLYSISAAVKSDTVFLRHVAERSGGRSIDLTALSTQEATRALINTSTRVTRVESNGASDLLLASPFATATGQSGRVQVAGVLNNKNAALQLTLQHPDGKTDTINANLGEALPSTAVAMRWATLKVNTLDAEYNLNRAEIRRLGQRFRLVTRETSLIVLDLVQDYARFEIAPPAELRDEFDRITSQMASQQRLARGNHLEQIVRGFEQKVKWWNHDFPKNDFYQEKNSRNKNRGDTTGELREQSASVGVRGATTNDLARDSETPMMAPPPPASPSPAAAKIAPLSEARRAKVPTPPGEPEDKSSFISGNQPGNNATIRLSKWEPDAAYAKRMKNANKEELYRIYLDEAPSYANSTAFYLDAADIFFEKGLTDLGLRVLSNLAEMDLENRHILRVLAYRLNQANRPALAIPVLKKVLALSPEEPQSYRDLGLAYAKNNESQRAIDTLNEVVIRPWHGRFPEVELITLSELNAIIATSSSRLDTSKIDPRLLKNLPLDLRAVLTWDADNTDIDLWVTDPNGERAFYGHRITYQGGRMSADFTGGYGPEEFSLKKAKPGKYKVEAQYYGDRQQNLTGATTLQVQFTSGFGTRASRDQVVTLRLKDRREQVFVGEFEIR